MNRRGVRELGFRFRGNGWASQRKSSSRMGAWLRENCQGEESWLCSVCANDSEEETSCDYGCSSRGGSGFGLDSLPWEKSELG
ncbi:hypothetical protein KFK09_000427 [Dendrobium nobile]|uniref:Uncharacterized protein n=1 Tax=Dendrobium nobile TaxID=94219 RepID=A0A8T3CDY3_DENNO|nr:hypothetical protein KFK09_000427 [Dendrobium nobile]